MITLSANPKGPTLPGLQCTTSFLGKYIEVLPKSMISSHVKVRFQTIPNACHLLQNRLASPFHNPCFLALEKSKDTTLAALATHLGLELPTIGFGAFLAFELHQVPDANATNHAESGQSHSSDESSQFVVKTYYNSNPTEGASSYALKCLALPLHEERLVKVEDCALGAIPLQEFSAHCEIPGVEETFQSFLSLCNASRTKPTRDALQDLFERSSGQKGLKWMSLKKWQERYSSAFRCFDSDNDGKLSCNEVQSALAEWGYSVSRETLETLFRLVDSDPESGEFDEEDLHLTMSALVGIRGGLHGQNVQLES